MGHVYFSSCSVLIEVHLLSAVDQFSMMACHSKIAFSFDKYYYYISHPLSAAVLLQCIVGRQQIWSFLFCPDQSLGRRNHHGVHKTATRRNFGADRHSSGEATDGHFCSWYQGLGSTLSTSMSCFQIYPMLIHVGDFQYHLNIKQNKIMYGWW